MRHVPRSQHLMSSDGFWHFLYMARTDARLKRQRHGHWNKWTKGPDFTELIILALLTAVAVLWLIEGVR